MEIYFCTVIFSMQFQYTLSLLPLAPSAPIGVQGTYPYVVWNVPDHPNGIITGYRLTFTRSGTSTQRTVTTNNDQTFYVIQSGDIPWSSGSITIKVIFVTFTSFTTCLRSILSQSKH